VHVAEDARIQLRNAIALMMRIQRERDVKRTETKWMREAAVPFVLLWMLIPDERGSVSCPAAGKLCARADN
jgi:hypothetical protein